MGRKHEEALKNENACQDYQKPAKEEHLIFTRVNFLRGIDPNQAPFVEAGILSAVT